MEDVLGGALATIIAATIAIRAVVLFGTVQEIELKVIIFAGAGALIFFVFLLVRYTIRYAFFICSKRRKACGLFVETYFKVDEDQVRFPLVALIVVYFNIFQDSLAVVGHAFRPTDRDKTVLSHHASWRSRVIDLTPSQDSSEASYLHRGEVEQRIDEIPGTTWCKFPVSAGCCQLGYFYDSPSVSRNGDWCHRVQFEIVRASKIQRTEFTRAIPIRSRPLYYLLLSAPGADVYRRFACQKGCTLIEDGERGPVMAEAWQILNRST